MYLRLFLSCPAMCQCIMRVFHFLLTLSSKCNVSCSGDGDQQTPEDLQDLQDLQISKSLLHNIVLDFHVLKEIHK